MAELTARGSGAARLDVRRLERLLAGFAQLRMLVVGDVMLDVHISGDVERVSPEAPIPVVHVQHESLVLGGAGNVLRNVLALGAEGLFCSVVGDDADGAIAIDLLKDLGVDPQGVSRVEGRPTTRKTRVVARGQQVVRFDRETTEPVAAPVARRVLAAIEAAAARADGAILEDYGKGLFSRRIARRAVQVLSHAGVPVAVDPKHEVAAFRGASLLKPNRQEAEVLSGVRIRGPEDLERIAARLRRGFGSADIAITRGGDGMTIFEGDAPGVDVPAVSREVFDPQGAGDTSIAALALAGRAGATLLEASVIANAAASVVVEKAGTATASPDEVSARLPEAVRVLAERT